MARTLADFAQQVAVDPAPASGSAAAYALALAAGLAEKVATRSPGVDPGVAARAQELRRQALRLVDDDEQAVNEMLASGAPTSAAVDVPKQIGEVAREVEELATMLIREGKPWLHADSVGALELARAAQRTVAAILAANSEQ